MLVKWNLQWSWHRFSLLKLHLDFELLFLPKCAKSLACGTWLNPSIASQNIVRVSSIQQNNWVWLRSASVKLNLKPKFRKIYLTNPYHFMLEILLRTSLLFWYMKILLRSFSFSGIKNVKAKFQSRYTYKLCTYKKRLYEMWKVIDYCENWFLRHFYEIYFQICPDFARIISTKLCFSSQN